MTYLGLVRIAGFVEGISAVCLFFVAMPLKYVWDIKQAVKWPGAIHGGLWLLYLLVVIVAYGRGKLTGKWVGILSFASLIPFGPFFVDRKLKKMEFGPPLPSGERGWG